VTRQVLLGLSLSTVVAAATAVFFDREAHAREITRARAERVERLTATDGWLTLVGLHFLKDGDNRVGSAGGNDIVLPGGPGQFGVATVAGGKVTFALEQGVAAKIGETAVRRAELQTEESGKPTVVAAGTLSFYVIERGGKKALRIKDSAAKRRTEFAGIEYFPIEPAWRIEARWVPFERSRQVTITNILGQVSPALIPGKAVFEHEGKTYELLPIDEGPGEPLFFVISDATSGKETYGAARFLYVDRLLGDRIVLDFNLTYNPPCAFTPFATCPLPPKENRLPFALTAGEKDYRGSHE
jgi:uncharacterized protein (DUF1684 family)